MHIVELKMCTRRSIRSFIIMVLNSDNMQKKVYTIMFISYWYFVFVNCIKTFNFISLFSRILWIHFIDMTIRNRYL